MSRWEPDRENYDLAHDRVKRARGAASSYPCVDCGEPAQEWSYCGNSPDERIDSTHRSGWPRKYSMNIWDYEPRCRPCHSKYDAPYRPLPTEELTSTRRANARRAAQISAIKRRGKPGHGGKGPRRPRTEEEKEKIRQGVLRFWEKRREQKD